LSFFFSSFVKQTYEVFAVVRPQLDPFTPNPKDLPVFPFTRLVAVGNNS